MTNCWINKGARLRDAVATIEKARKTISVVLDSHRKVMGTISDGDIRRALLAGFSLDDDVSVALNKEPVTAKSSFSDKFCLNLIQSHGLEAVPVTDDDGVYQYTLHLNDLATNSCPEHVSEYGAAVIMAGGEGRRLRPITNNIPKPMVRIDDVPLIELQVKRLVKAGIKKIFVSVNYLSHVIEEHLSDGSQFGASISYLKEDKKLGTAGALSLVEDPPDKPILVINGDVFTKVDLGNLVKFHLDLGSMMTVAAVEYNVNIPYGVIRAEGSSVKALEEKPSQRFLCNAGIYVISKETFGKIPYNEYFDITELIEKFIGVENGVSVFPVHEYWADIGSPLDLERIRNEIKTNNCLN